MWWFALGQLYAQQTLTATNKKTIRLYREARQLYAVSAFDEAQQLLNLALEREPAFIEAMLLLADLYHTKGNHQAELVTLKRAIQTDSAFYIPAYFNAGEAAFRTGNYDEAMELLGSYNQKMTDPSAIKKAGKLIEQARFAKKSLENTRDIVLRNEGKGINSPYDEYWPSLTADGQTLVVTALVPRDELLYREKGTELPRSSVYFREDFFVVAAAGDSSWQSRQPLPGSINTQNNEGAQSLSADGNWMFFTACGRPDSKGSCDIYFSRRTEQGWSKPVNIGAPVNTPFWESQPCFSADGRTLLFVSNRGGGVGGKDIWQVTLQGFRQDGSPYFGNLMNLGKAVNTAGDENSPFLHHDGQTLYFSSDGHIGMGGMDLFMSRKNSSGEWEQPLNLGVPINTSDDEIGLIVNARGDRAYFSSDGQPSGMGGKDIYSFELPQALRPGPVLYVKGKVYDVETHLPLAAAFDLVDIESGDLTVKSRANPSDGSFLVSLPTGGAYAFKADHPGYLFYSGHFNLAGPYLIDRPFLLDIGLQPIKKGASIRLENVFFETDAYQLAPESKAELNELVTFLKNYPDVRILLEGHTDNTGNEAYNIELSTNRARSVYNYLTGQGIESGRLEYKGFGFSRPVESNETPEGRARNRRTEMRIL